MRRSLSELWGSNGGTEGAACFSRRPFIVAGRGDLFGDAAADEVDLVERVDCRL